MHFVVGLQVNEHVFFNLMKISRGVFQLKLCQTARKRRPHDFFTHFDIIFWICAEANIVPLNLEKWFSCLMRYAVCNGIHTHKLQLKSFDQTASVYFLGIFFWINYGIFGTILWRSGIVQYIYRCEPYNVDNSAINGGGASEDGNLDKTHLVVWQNVTCTCHHTLK